MIAKLTGTIAEQGIESLVLDVGGVGYEVHCSSMTMGELPSVTAGERRISLWIYTCVREDSLTLYGFHNLQDKLLFTSLLMVNGVGPKMAIKVLSAAPSDHIVQMIETGDAAGLSKLPKIGKKTAEQMVVTLKGKLAGIFVSQPMAKPSGMQRRSELASALVNLGYRPAEVEQVVKQMPIDIDLQTGIRQALVALTQSL